MKTFNFKDGNGDVRTIKANSFTTDDGVLTFWMSFGIDRYNQTANTPIAAYANFRWCRQVDKK